MSDFPYPSPPASDAGDGPEDIDEPEVTELGLHEWLTLLAVSTLFAVAYTYFLMKLGVEQAMWQLQRILQSI